MIEDAAPPCIKTGYDLDLSKHSLDKQLCAAYDIPGKLSGALSICISICRPKNQHYVAKY